MANLPKIALGTWAWGNDDMFGTVYTEEQLRPIFDSAMAHGLNLWDTAYAYGMGTRHIPQGACTRHLPHRGQTHAAVCGSVLGHPRSGYVGNAAEAARRRSHGHLLAS